MWTIKFPNISNTYTILKGQLKEGLDFCFDRMVQSLKKKKKAFIKYH